MTSSGECTFVCPECGESIEVNGAMQEALIEQGCVVCSAAVKERDFTG
jgi:predicted nucleic acid-binding Zn ribbon protein